MMASGQRRENGGSGRRRCARVQQVIDPEREQGKTFPFPEDALDQLPAFQSLSFFPGESLFDRFLF